MCLDKDTSLWLVYCIYMFNEMIIMFNSNIILYSLVIIILMISNRMFINKMIEIKVNKIMCNMNLYNIISMWSLLVVITLISHIMFKIGIYNMILYNICYWLLFIGLGMYMLVYLIYVYELMIYVYDTSSYMFNVSNIYSKGLSMFHSSNYNMCCLYCILDLGILLICINLICNWLYQILYYGLRMWLVFVLHEFSIGSFGSLSNVICSCNILCGLCGIGIILFIVVIVYLCIQIYVYISFSLYFLESTIFLLFVFSCGIFGLFSRCYYLIPVSIVDVFGSILDYVVSCSVLISYIYKYLLYNWYVLIIMTGDNICFLL